MHQRRPSIALKNLEQYIFEKLKKQIKELQLKMYILIMIVLIFYFVLTY